MNTKLLLQDLPAELHWAPGVRPESLAEIDKRADTAFNPYPIFTTRGVLRKIRGTREGKCAAAFAVVSEGIKCR